MPKLKIDDLQRIVEESRRTILLREGAGRARVTVHMGSCGLAAGAKKILDRVLELIAETQVKDVLVTTTGCAGLCSHEPMATVELVGEAPIKYIDLTEEKITTIFKEHVLNGKIVTQYALGLGSEQTR
ncbi:MAG: (2Fe-2S) ferredoxin domain-containing protein [bacterium]